MSRSSFTKAKAAAIVARLSGGEPLAKICRDKGMPKVRTVSDWRAAHPEFDAAFLQARDDGFDALAAECLEIADQPNKRTTADGEVHESDHHRDKLRVETRLRLLSKWDPRRYGEKVQHTGADGEGPIQIQPVLNVSIGGPRS